MNRFLALLMLVLCSAVWAEDWQLQSNRDTIAVYTADIPGQELRAFRGVTIVPAPIRSVVALLGDVENMPAWFYQMKSARELDQGPVHGHYQYLVIAGIWPVKDRDVVVRASTIQQSNGAIVITAIAQPDKLPRQDCCVRIPRLESTWLVRAVDGSRTEVTLTTSSHPGGSLPLWIANLVATDMPRKTLEALRTEVRKPAYAQVDSKGSAKSLEFLGRFSFRSTGAEEK